MFITAQQTIPRRKVVWGPKRTLVAAALVFGLSANGVAASGTPGSQVRNYKADDAVSARARGNPLQTSSVIVTFVPGAELPTEFANFARGGKLDIINGQVLELPNGLINRLAAHPNIFRLHDDRSTFAHNYR